MADLRTPAEIAYDNLKDGSAWFAVQAITDDPADDGQDSPLSAEEKRALDILLATTPTIPSRDEAHRQQRWAAVMDHLAEADDDEINEVIYLLEELERRFDTRRADG